MKIITGIAKPLGVVAALFLVGLGGFACTEVKDTLDGADRTLSGALNTDDPEFEGLSGGELAEAIYQKGLGLRDQGRNEDAFAHFLDAAERGHGPAAYETGEAYNAGLGVEKDLNAGAKWINAAAARGEPRAQYAVGAALYNGAGVEQDYVRAVRYLGNAASQGHPGGQYLLGECYANGRGVTKNLSWAARWYGKAAAQGHADGAFSYGVVQAAGLGLPKNLTSGYAWLDIASNRGHGKAGEVRAAIANKMTPLQIEEAKSRASAFRPSNEADFADKPTVMYVQHSLNQLGFNAGPVDGLSGPRTRNAIGAYLSSVGAEGEADITPEVLQKIFEGQQAGASSV
ncbi:SEL1-like repeat protein [Pelagibius sp. CAU 1746]|uniref:SEL1-like repeat protein n=1 Tax=Pelagibius sp. CAU 1746 TaxID=3140370 RepID=UPI00325B7924